MAGRSPGLFEHCVFAERPLCHRHKLLAALGRELHRTLRAGVETILWQAGRSHSRLRRRGAGAGQSSSEQFLLLSNLVDHGSGGIKASTKLRRAKGRADAGKVECHEARSDQLLLALSWADVEEHHQPRRHEVRARCSSGTFRESGRQRRRAHGWQRRQRQASARTLADESMRVAWCSVAVRVDAVVEALSLAAAVVGALRRRHRPGSTLRC
mmetsp:Transcript_73506/g.186261  ORF Transcript_73506/g.186261 Transcript_73506/m.186261 type:complete len:212 (+) Transcript_73506:583-1218(+)